MSVNAKLNQIFQDQQIKALANLLRKLKADSERHYAQTGSHRAMHRAEAFQTAIEAMECLGLPSYPEVPAMQDTAAAIQHEPHPETSNRYKVYVYNMEERIV